MTITVKHTLVLDVNGEPPCLQMSRQMSRQLCDNRVKLKKLAPTFCTMHKEDTLWIQDWWLQIFEYSNGQMFLRPKLNQG